MTRNSISNSDDRDKWAVAVSYGCLFWQLARTHLALAPAPAYRAELVEALRQNGAKR